MEASWTRPLELLKLAPLRIQLTLPIAKLGIELGILVVDVGVVPNVAVGADDVPGDSHD